jgi:hypothetical protein
MKNLLRQTAASAFALILLSGGMLFAQDSEVTTIQKRVEETQAMETETLRDILKLTAAIKASASPKDIEEDDVIKLEDNLGRAVWVESRSFGSYNEPVGTIIQKVPTDEKTVTKKITDLLKSAREDSQKAIKFFKLAMEGSQKDGKFDSEKKYTLVANKVKDVEKRLEGLQLQFDARSEVRTKRLAERAKIEEKERAKAEEKAKASPKK